MKRINEWTTEIISKFCYICEEEFKDKHAKDEEYGKTRTIAIIQSIKEYRGASHSLCNFKYSLPVVIPTVFHNGSNRDYHFIIKELAKEFKKQFTCLGANTKKCITFSVPIQKEVNKNR